jgi:enediyne biosynthesis protein E5
MSQQVVVPDKKPVAKEISWRKIFSLDNRFIPPIFITLILLVGNISYGILESWKKTLLAIAVSMLAEMVLGKIFLGKWPHPASAYITGISVGILLRSPAFWPFALCSLISITSKYVLRWKGHHIWNPSNFGISVLLFLAGDTVASLSIQWGNFLPPMVIIWILGSLIMLRARRFNITATYVLSFLFFSLVRTWITGNPWLSEVSPLTGPEYQLYIFFMITDPKTTVKNKWAQCLVAFCIAFVEMILRLNQVVYAPFYALFLVGPIATVTELWMQSRRPKLQSTTA